MPAVGFDVVPSDCLAAHVAQRLPGASQLTIAVTGLGLITRASLKTLIEAWGGGVVRRDGVLTAIPLGSLQRSFDYATAAPELSVIGGSGDGVLHTGIPTSIPTARDRCCNVVRGPILRLGTRMSPWQIGEKRGRLDARGTQQTSPRLVRYDRVEGGAVRGSRRAWRVGTLPKRHFPGVTAPRSRPPRATATSKIGFQTPHG